MQQRVLEVEGLGKGVGELQDRVNRLLGENKKLTEELRVANEGIRSAAREREQGGGEREQMSRRIDELENKLVMVAQENERLTLTLRNKSQ